MTTEAIVAKAMKDLHVLQQGLPPSGDDLTDVLEAANLMLDSWKTNRLTVFQVIPTDFPLVDGVGVYTMGTGGSLSATRPMYIPRASIMWYGNATMPIEEPVKILTYQEWQVKVPVKTGVPSTIPYAMFDDHAYPLRSLQLYPVPTQTSLSKLRLYLPGQIDSLVLGQTYDFAPGMMEAVTSNLAIRIAPQFDREPSDALKSIASVTFAGVKRVNDQLEPGELTCDRAMLGRPGRWDWPSDTFR